MLRARPSRLALTSVGAALAAIIGVQLGQSTISQINPIHFQGPLAPQGITPPPEPAPFDPYAQPYVWSMNPPSIAVDCGVDCDRMQTQQAMRLAMADSAGRDSSLPYWRDATPNTQLQPWAPGAVPGGGTFERYMHYPIDREQAERPQAEPAVVQTAPAAPAEALRPPPAPDAPPPAPLAPEAVVRE